MTGTADDRGRPKPPSPILLSPSLSSNSIPSFLSPCLLHLRLHGTRPSPRELNSPSPASAYQKEKKDGPKTNNGSKQNSCQMVLLPSPFPRSSRSPISISGEHDERWGTKGMISNTIHKKNNSNPFQRTRK